MKIPQGAKIREENAYYQLIAVTYPKMVKRRTAFWDKRVTHKAVRLFSNHTYWLIDKETNGRVMKTQDVLKICKEYVMRTEDKVNRIDKILLDDE